MGDLFRPEGRLATRLRRSALRTVEGISEIGHGKYMQAYMHFREVALRMLSVSLATRSYVKGLKEVNEAAAKKVADKAMVQTGNAIDAPQTRASMQGHHPETAGTVDRAADSAPAL